MTGAYLFHGRDGSTYYAIVWFNGYINMVRFITTGGLDAMLEETQKRPSGVPYVGRISFAAACLSGRFVRLVPGPNHNFGVGWSERSAWLSTVPKPVRRAVQSGNRSDDDQRNGASGGRIDPILRYLMEHGRRERAVEHSDEHSGRTATADKSTAANGARSALQSQSKSSPNDPCRFGVGREGLEHSNATRTIH